VPADRVLWLDGSEAQKREITAEACRTGELLELNPQTLPGCLYHRTALNDVARTEGLTYVCTSNEGDAGTTNNWMAPEEAYDRAAQIFAGSMRGERCMSFRSRWAVGLGLQQVRRSDHR